MSWTNPLRDPEDRRLPRIAGPCGMVLFGVTGDLARKKLMPAIYDLANRGLLPPGFSLVGFARRDWADQDFAQIVHDAVKSHARTEFREEVWRQLSEGFRFVPGDFSDDLAFDQLRRTIEELDQVRGTDGNHAFYLSIPPRFFGDVVQQLQEHGLAHPDSESWRRVVVEVSLDETEPLGELVPDLLAELGAGVLLHRVVHDLREVLVDPVAASEPHQTEARRQQATIRQVVDRGHHLLARQVAGDAEDHHPARARNAWQPPVLGVAERVEVWRRGGGSGHRGRAFR